MQEEKQRWTDQAELDTLLAVSTVPPSMTSFMPSSMLEPPTPPTRGWTRDLIASMILGCDVDSGKEGGRKIVV
jgi:hypothetical protein